MFKIDYGCTNHQPTNQLLTQSIQYNSRYFMNNISLNTSTWFDSKKLTVEKCQ